MNTSDLNESFMRPPQLSLNTETYILGGSANFNVGLVKKNERHLGVSEVQPIEVTDPLLNYI